MSSCSNSWVAPFHSVHVVACGGVAGAWASAGDPGYAQAHCGSTCITLCTRPEACSRNPNSLLRLFLVAKSIFFLRAGPSFILGSLDVS